MISRRQSSVALAVGFFIAFSAPQVWAATIVKVELWDQGAATTMGTGMSYGAPGLDMSKATMGMKASAATAPAGIVSFEVANTSKDTVHEMIVDPSKPLCYIDRVELTRTKLATKVKSPSSIQANPELSPLLSSRESTS